MTRKLAWAGLAPLLLVCSQAAADEETLLNNEVLVSPARATPALKKPPTTYVIGYKRLLTPAWAVRVGADGSYSDAKNGERKIDLAVGVERQHRLGGVWIFYWGAELSYATTHYGGRSDYLERYGVSPLVGATYFVHPNFSVATEVKVDVYQNRFRNPEAFDPSANSEELTVALGGLGSLLLGFHF